MTAVSPEALERQRERQRQYSNKRYLEMKADPAFRAPRRAATKAWEARNPEKHAVARHRERSARKLRKYGLTQDQYQQMLVAQGGTCKTCPATKFMPHPNDHRVLAVDHCHRTGKVRGLLCSRCNILAGAMEMAGRDLLDRLAMYLAEA